MTRDQISLGPDIFSFSNLAWQWCEILCALELALWKDLVEPLCPSGDDRPHADARGQLVIPEPIAADDEHGLFA